MADIGRFFSGEALIRSVLPQFRERPTQVQAARLVMESLTALRHAVIEAPTGSGKTFSYLIPVFEKGGRTIISTKTKQLMRQLMEKDIAAISPLFGGKVFAAQLKGRKNYFCPERFYRLIYPNASMYPDAIEWFQSVADRDIIEVPWGKISPEVAERMTADSLQCRHSRCQFISECPFYRARDRANSADIIVTNHHLLLTDIAAKSRGGFSTIFEYADHIIFDEAHAVLDIFPLYSGCDVNLLSIVNLARENKLTFGLREVDTIEIAYTELRSHLREARMPYEEIADRTMAFMDTCREIIMACDDEDIRLEFAKSDAAMKRIGSDEEGVRIAEKREHALIARFVPLDVSQPFAEGLKEAALSAVFISATMTAGRDFSYFLRETGLNPDDTITEVLPPVFDLAARGRLYVPDIPDEDTFFRLYKGLAREVPGSVLVICNSVSRMEKVAEYLRQEDVPKTVYTQLDVDFNELEDSSGAVLVGCALLREGIDLAGCGFTCVVLDKLPFEYPHDVYYKEKAAQVEKEMGDSFNHYSLPRAVLFFKQAVGRLIRHEDDKGLWVVADKRILTKKYGKNFLDVLPNVRRVERFSDAIRFLSEDEG